MHRLLVPTGELEKDAPALPKEARDHLKVLRPKDGEEIELFDGRGCWRVYRLDGGGRETRVAGREKPLSSVFCLRPSSSVFCHLSSPLGPTLFACVTKGSRWDWTVEKATELGVTRIVPVISERTIVRIAADEREAKRARWTRIAEEAARQSDAKWIPEVLAPVTFADSLALVKETRCFVGALTTPPPKMIAEAIGQMTPPAREVTSSTGGRNRTARDSRAAAIYVGPEGDFTPEELAALVAIATPVSFGSTILRAETAAIYGLSVLKSWLDANLPHHQTSNLPNLQTSTPPPLQTSNLPLLQTSNVPAR